MKNSQDLKRQFPEEKDIPVAYRPLFQDQKEYLVNGLFRIWSGPQQEVFSPIPLRRGEKFGPRLLGRCPSLNRDAAAEALEGARKAFSNGRGKWPTLGISSRVRIMRNLCGRLAGKRKEIVVSLMWEVGKSRAEAEAEFERTLQYLEETFAEIENQLRRPREEAREGILGRVGTSPRGVVLCLGPFNYPLNETFATLMPALVMGNTAIVKPPRHGVLLFRPLLSIFRDLFPPGVVNVIYGDGDEVVRPLMESGAVDVLAFIGSARVAQDLVRAHPNPLRLTTVLGLGAKNAGVVLPDADLERAVRECLVGSLAFNGQRCTALKILFVHRSQVEPFLDFFCRGVEKVRWGMPWERGVWLTPLAEPERPAYLRNLLEDALTHGAKIVNPSGGPGAGPCFPATVVYPVKRSMKLWREEQFGPLVPIAPFDDFSEVACYLEDSNFGQQISLFGGDPESIAPLVDPLVNQVGRVNINCKCQRGPDHFPFGGRKDSAVGTLSVKDALRGFSLPAVVAVRDGREGRALMQSLENSHQTRFLVDY